MDQTYVTIALSRLETLIKAEAERDALLRVLLDHAKLGYLHEDLRFDEEKVNTVLSNVCPDLYRFKLGQLTAEYEAKMEVLQDGKI